MAKKVVKKDTQRHLTAAETRRLHDAVDKARRLAWKMANDKRYYDSTRKYVAQVLKDMEKVSHNANWARMSNYKFG